MFTTAAHDFSCALSFVHVYTCKCVLQQTCCGRNHGKQLSFSFTLQKTKHAANSPHPHHPQLCTTRNNHNPCCAYIARADPTHAENTPMTRVFSCRALNQGWLIVCRCLKPHQCQVGGSDVGQTSLREVAAEFQPLTPSTTKCHRDGGEGVGGEGEGLAVVTQQGLCVGGREGCACVCTVGNESKHDAHAWVRTAGKTQCD